MHDFTFAVRAGAARQGNRNRRASEESGKINALTAQARITVSRKRTVAIDPRTLVSASVSDLA